MSRDLPAGPLDLASKRFGYALFGYSRTEVDSYLHTLSERWEDLLTPARNVAIALENIRARTHGERPYESLGADVADILAAASASADRTRADADQALVDALHRADEIVSHATIQAQRLISGAERERDELLGSNRDLRARLSGIVREVGPLLDSAPVIPTQPEVTPPRPAATEPAFDESTDFLDSVLKEK